MSGSVGWAQDTPPSHSRAEREIKQILEQPQFQQYEEQLRIVPLHKVERTKQPNTGRFAAFFIAVAELLRGLVWVALAVGFLCALYWGFRRWQGARTPERSHWAPPDTLFGLDVRPQALPADVAAVARQLAQAGDLVGALSLLYRGALTTLLHRDHIELASGDTEADCLLKTRTRIADPAYLYLASLLAAWQGAAYAHRMPSQPEVSRLATDWPGFFGADA